MVPSEINENITKLLQVLKSAYEPVFIEVNPEPNSSILDCFQIVSEKVASSGGEIIYGWAIWEHKYFIEAECHAVWEDSNENLIDITPKINAYPTILFVEDERIKYEGKQISNIRVNTSKKPIVDDLIAVCDAYFRLTNKGELAYVVGDISKYLTEKQHGELYFIATCRNIILRLLELDRDIDSICLCGSGRKYKNCHGQNLIKEMERI